MAEEEKKEVAEEKKSKMPKIPKPKSSLVLIVVLVVVGIVLAGGISFFVAAKIAGDRTVTVIKKREPGVLMRIGDSKDGVVLNIGGTTGRYLKMVMTLEVEPVKGADGKVAVSQQDEIKIQDATINFLRSQKIDAFTPANQEKLKEEIKTVLNKKLGSDRVLDVFITNVVIQ